jgi:hypothetical protein
MVQISPKPVCDLLCVTYYIEIMHAYLNTNCELILKLHGVTSFFWYSVHDSMTKMDNSNSIKNYAKSLFADRKLIIKIPASTEQQLH